MSRIRNLIVAGALAFATGLPVVSTAEAGPMAPAPIQIEKSSDVTNVRVVCGRWGCRRANWRGRNWRARRYYGPRRYWGPRRVWVAPVIIVPGYRRAGNPHVRWCLNRYGSYNPRTDMFLSYDGYYKRCISPY